jgi:hypothetical protein
MFGAHAYSAHFMFVVWLPAYAFRIPSESYNSSRVERMNLKQILIKLPDSEVLTRGSVLVKTLCYNPEGRGFDSR